MKIKRYPIELLKKQLKDIIGRYLDLDEYNLFLFGSRVMESGNDRSDLGLMGPPPFPTRLWGKFAKP